MLSNSSVMSELAGKSYWEGMNSVLTTPLTQIPNTIDAINVIKDLAIKIISNISVPVSDVPSLPESCYNTGILQVVDANNTDAHIGDEYIRVLVDKFNVVTSVIQNQPLNVPVPPVELFKEQSVVLANISWLQTQVPLWLDATHPSWTSGTVFTNKCKRDIATIVMAVVADTLVANNNAKFDFNSRLVGNSYWQGTTSVLTAVNEKQYTADAILQIKYLVGKLVNGDMSLNAPYTLSLIHI